MLTRRNPVRSANFNYQIPASDRDLIGSGASNLDGHNLRGLISVLGSVPRSERTHHQQKIDRQLRMLMTWDRRLHKYRIWRFSTVDVEEGLEGEACFEGNELIMEWQSLDPGTPERVLALYRNRITMKSPDELVIVTEGQRLGGKVERIGITKARRRL